MNILYIRKKPKSQMKVVCSWCGEEIRTVDGGSVEGTSYGICRKCEKKHFGDLPRIPARWNLAGRLIAHFRNGRVRDDIDRQVAERESLAEIILKDPRLHAQCILRGCPNVHYLTMEAMAELQARVADQPEFTYKWN